MGWIGVDLDGTLAEHKPVSPLYPIGPPIKPMVKRIQKWLAEGVEVRIVTARVTLEAECVGRTKTVRIKDDYDIVKIRRWCRKHIGQALFVTCIKDFEMWELWDDRAVAVERNTGKQLSPSNF